MSSQESKNAFNEVREAVRSLQNQNISDKAIIAALLQVSQEVSVVKNTGR